MSLQSFSVHLKVQHVQEDLFPMLCRHHVQPLWQQHEAKPSLPESRRQNLCSCIAKKHGRKHACVSFLTKMSPWTAAHHMKSRGARKRGGSEGGPGGEREHKDTERMTMNAAAEKMEQQPCARVFRERDPAGKQSRIKRSTEEEEGRQLWPQTQGTGSGLSWLKQETDNNNGKEGRATQREFEGEKGREIDKNERLKALKAVLVEEISGSCSDNNILDWG